MATTLTSSPASTRSLPDPFDRPAKRLWHTSAPKAVSTDGRPSELDDETWKAWAAHLASRTEPVALGDLLSGKACPLTWNLPDDTTASDTATFLSALARLQKKKRPSDPPWQEQLEPWLAEAAETAPRAAYALECLAVAHALPRLAACTSPELWWELLAHLTHAATEPRGVTLSADPLTVQLIRGELPLTLSYLFPEIRPCRDLKTPAHQELSAGLVELLDGEGMPRCDYLHLLRPLLACWTRCRAIGEQTKKNCWNTDADDEYQWLITQALRLSRADGVGGEVAPNEGPPGPHSVFADVATPFEGVPCDCHALLGDGQVDLSMKFRTPNAGQICVCIAFQTLSVLSNACMNSPACWGEFSPPSTRARSSTPSVGT